MEYLYIYIWGCLKIGMLETYSSWLKSNIFEHRYFETFPYIIYIYIYIRSRHAICQHTSYLTPKHEEQQGGAAYWCSSCHTGVELSRPDSSRPGMRWQAKIWQGTQGQMRVWKGKDWTMGCAKGTQNHSYLNSTSRSVLLSRTRTASFNGYRAGQLPSTGFRPLKLKIVALKV